MAARTGVEGRTGVAGRARPVRRDGSADLHSTTEACRSCGARGLEEVLDLGETPLADRLLTEEELADSGPTCPLTVAVCGACGLLQIRETVRPEVLFGNDYPYYSSVSPSLRAHFRDSVEEVLGRRELGPDDLVVELASNDGCLLRNYVRRGIPVLGIDPAEGPAARAEEEGVPTLVTFFTRERAEELAADGVRADVLHANNVLAHVADTNGFVEGIARILADDGEAVLEFPYVRDLVERVEFDTIYHQHLCYFSVTSVRALFARHGLVLRRVERIPIHGGSLRVFVARGGTPGPSVERLLAEERELGVDRPAWFRDFGERVDRLRSELRALLDELRADGSRMAGYGAAAKGCTLMSAVGIDGTDLEAVVDLNEFKQGRYLPGSRIPIRPVEWLLETMPDHVLILAWNFAEEIMEQQSEYRARGGRFILPVPTPRLI